MHIQGLKIGRFKLDKISNDSISTNIDMQLSRLYAVTKLIELMKKINQVLLLIFHQFMEWLQMISNCIKI